MLTEKSRIVFFHILVDKHKNSFPEPARFVGYLILLQITVHNPQFLLTHQAYDALFAFGFIGRCFRTRFVSLSHISCKISVPIANSKRKKRKFVSRYKKDGNMAAHNRLGKAGEDAAVAYLKQNGYTILHRNWRKNHLELDIVATNNGELVVVEVKTRTNTDYREPQEAVDWRKVRHIVVAADSYIKHFGIDLPVRFDIVTAIGEQAPFRMEHLENAFYPPLF